MCIRRTKGGSGRTTRAFYACAGGISAASYDGLRLRPGEKLVRYWDNVGKQVVRGPRMHPEVRFSNGKLVYRPDLRSPLCLMGTEGLTNVAQEGSGRRAALHPARAGQVSEVVWKVASPYAIPGVQVGITCRRETREDGLEVLFSRMGRTGVRSGSRADRCARADRILCVGWTRA